MNRVITINLNGNAYQLEESGYEALRAYLDHAARRLEGNPDKDEIIADIEQAIAEKFRAVLGVNKTVVITREVTEVIGAMGPVEDSSTEGKSVEATGQPQATGAKASERSNTTGAAENGPQGVRRLYRIYPEGAMLSGVCNGLAGYLNVDATLIRVGFVLLTLLWGLGVLLYLLMVVIVPIAVTPAEKSAAAGAAATAQEFIRRAKAGYYGMKTFHDKHAHREWKRKFKQEMRGWKHNFQREMYDGTYNWRQHWAPQSGQPHPKFWVGMGFTLMILKWVRLLFLFLGIYAVYSLATKGGVFGVLLPAGIPLWVGIVAIIVIYQLLTLPLKALQFSCYYHGMPPHACAPWLAGPFAGLIWLGFLVAVIWLADHYVPQFHEALKPLPPLLHQAVDAVQRWLERT